MDKSEKKRLIVFIKDKYPIGSYVYDNSHPQPYKITKRTIFDVEEWESEKPDALGEMWVEFSVRNPGRETRVFHINSFPKKWTYSKLDQIKQELFDKYGIKTDRDLFKQLKITKDEDKRKIFLWINYQREFSYIEGKYDGLNTETE